MKYKSLARKYAIVLMKISQDDSELKKIESELESFCAILRGLPDTQRFFTKPVVSRTKKLELVDQLCKKLHFFPTTQKFLAVLADRERLNIIEDILGSLEQLKDEKNNIVPVGVIAASKLNTDVKKKIIALFQSKLNKNIRLSVKIDPSIVGGMITKIGSTIYDGSVQGQLLKIKEKIMRE
jgi:F-type H+-transporting ATPase subunit delta